MGKTSAGEKDHLGKIRGGGLAEFYIHSGPRRNCFCVTDPKYRMPAPPPLERWERARLDDIEYQ